MREIRFRSWDKIRKEMLYSDTQKDFDKMLIHWDFINGWSATRAKDRFVLSNANAVLMQYTGLKDKSGKEIYEGDIVRMTFRENIGTFNVPDDIIANGGYTGREDIYEGEVVYEGACFGINDKENGVMQLVVAEEDLETEIIGNLYENPELLNQ
jgi:uncharacterized phage protein (TIGR01671 family)